MLFNELGNFKFVMLFMLIPISNLWMNGFFAAAIWIGILVYVLPPLMAYMLARFELGQPNHMHPPRHDYRLVNTMPQLSHEALSGELLIAKQLHHDLHDNPIAGIKLAKQSHSFSHKSTEVDFWQCENNSFANDISSHTTDTADDESHFHSKDYDPPLFSHHDVFDSHGINPASGLPMMDSSIDIHGNMYGTNSADDFINSHTWDCSFNHHSSFDNTNAFTHHDDYSNSPTDSCFSSHSSGDRY